MALGEASDAGDSSPVALYSAGTLVTHQRKIVHPMVVEMLKGSTEEGEAP